MAQREGTSRRLPLLLQAGRWEAGRAYLGDSGEVTVVMRKTRRLEATLLFSLTLQRTLHSAAPPLPRKFHEPHFLGAEHWKGGEALRRTAHPLLRELCTPLALGGWAPALHPLPHLCSSCLPGPHLCTAPHLCLFSALHLFSVPPRRRRLAASSHLCTQCHTALHSRTIRRPSHTAPLGGGGGGPYTTHLPPLHSGREEGWERPVPGRGCPPPPPPPPPPLELIYTTHTPREQPGLWNSSSELWALRRRPARGHTPPSRWWRGHLHTSWAAHFVTPPHRASLPEEPPINHIHLFGHTEPQEGISCTPLSPLPHYLREPPALFSLWTSTGLPTLEESPPLCLGEPALCLTGLHCTLTLGPHTQAHLTLSSGAPLSHFASLTGKEEK